MTLPVQLGEAFQAAARLAALHEAVNRPLTEALAADGRHDDGADCERVQRGHVGVIEGLDPGALKNAALAPQPELGAAYGKLVDIVHKAGYFGAVFHPRELYGAFG